MWFIVSFNSLLTYGSIGYINKIEVSTHVFSEAARWERNRVPILCARDPVCYDDICAKAVAPQRILLRVGSTFSWSRSAVSFWSVTASQKENTLPSNFPDTTFIPTTSKINSFLILCNQSLILFNLYLCLCMSINDFTYSRNRLHFAILIRRIFLLKWIKRKTYVCIWILSWIVGPHYIVLVKSFIMYLRAVHY